MGIDVLTIFSFLRSEDLYSSWIVKGWCLTIFAFPSFKSRRTLPRRKVGIKRSPLLLRTQTQVLMQGTPFVNNESISQGLRPVVHIANVVVLFYLSVWCLHVSYPQRFLTNTRRAHHLWSMSKVPILLVHNVVSCRRSSRLRLINRAYGLPRKPRL